ncbi:MAG: hypothetical protein MZV70_18095 [Desulfobacterales bacterium]|nr:hypothetical protein [Desulfobacterales bacterium]
MHPSSISRARGQRNANCAALKREFGFSAVRVISRRRNLDEDVDRCCRRRPDCQDLRVA